MIVQIPKHSQLFKLIIMKRTMHLLQSIQVSEDCIIQDYANYTKITDKNDNTNIHSKDNS